MKKLAVLRTISIASILMLLGMNVVAQEIWSFDGERPLVSQNGKTELLLNGNYEKPELTGGIIGKGFRTDGYTTWLKGEIDHLKVPYGISAWYALESFPTDTAAFFGVRDSLKERSIALCVNRFGELMFGVGKCGAYSYHSVDYSVERFKWIHLAFWVDKEGFNLMVNGVDVPVKPGLNSAPASINEIFVANDFRRKVLGVQDLTMINGIVDELHLYNSVIHKQEVLNEVAQLSGKAPVLAVPESRFKDDFNRPKYHLLPAANWTNETHGLIYYHNKYHLFNQKNASNLHLRQINWGHFSSPDLVNWTEHKPVLSPEPGYDQNGIWSGHVVINDDGIPTIIYTAGGERMDVGIAFPKDSDLVVWEKYEGNPVISGQPDGFKRTDLRDPYVWKDGDTWYLIIGFGLVENGVEKGTLLLYSSPDLKKWTFLHPLFKGNPEVDGTGIFWEMPVFKKIGEKYVLLVNPIPHNGVPARAKYWVGVFKDERFIPDDPMPENLEVINRLLSPSVAYDEEGRIIAIAIIPDEFGDVPAYHHGWTHLYSIPRVWNLKGEKILLSPHPALKALRDKHAFVKKQVVVEDKPLKISESHQVEVKATIHPRQAKKFGFIVGKNADNSEFTKIYYDTENHEMVVDRTFSSLNKKIPKGIKRDKYALDLSKAVDFHLFIDGSVVEVFINNEDAFTTRIFPTKKESYLLEFFTEGGSIEVSAEVWQMKPADMKTEF